MKVGDVGHRTEHDEKATAHIRHVVSSSTDPPSFICFMPRTIQLAYAGKSDLFICLHLLVILILKRRRLNLLKKLILIPHSVYEQALNLECTI